MLKPEGGKQAIKPGCGRKVGARCGRPPGGLGGDKAHAPAPERSRHFRTLHPFQKYVSFGWIEIGDGAQETGLARARRAFDREAGNRFSALRLHGGKSDVSVLSKAGAGSLAPGWRKQTLPRGCQHMRGPAGLGDAALKTQAGGAKPVTGAFLQGQVWAGAACGGEKPGCRADLDTLAFHLAGQLVDELLGARPVGVHLQQLLEGFEGSLFLADLAQDLAEPIEGLEVIGIERQRAA